MITQINGKIARAAFLIFLVLAWAGQGRSQETTDFSVSPPPESKLMDTHKMRMGGTDISSFLYQSSAQAEEIMKYYRGFFEQNKFKIILDKQDKQSGMLKGQKDKFMVNIVTRPQDGGAEVVIAHYLQPEGLSPLEEPKPSWGEVMAMLPKEDQPGEDLQFIPRPPGSVRLSIVNRPNFTYLVYSSSSPPKEVREFYKKRMPSHGWEMDKEIETAGVMKQLQESVAKKGTKVNLPMPGGSLEQLASGGYILYFKGYRGKAEVGLLSNSFSDKGTGSFVQIRYAKE